MRVKMLSHNPFLRFFLSPLVTILLIGATEYLRQEDYNISLGLPLMGFTLCLFWSGVRANIISAMFITAYALGHSAIWDTSRFAILLGTVWPVAIIGGLLKYWLIKAVQESERHRLWAEENQVKADFVDSLNGNIISTRNINNKLISMINQLPHLTKDEISVGLQMIQDEAADLAQRTVGWHQLYLEKKEIVERGE